MLNRKRLWLPVIILMISVLACSMPGSISNEDKLRTQMAESEALLPATDTPDPMDEGADVTPTHTTMPTRTETALPTFTSTIPVIPTFTDAPEFVPTDTPEACDVGTYVADITVPDNTEFSPGESFTKTWRLKNVGSCTWTTAYEAIFESGDHMNGPNDVNLTKDVPPGDTIDISVALKAPNSPGTYTGNWMLRNSDGEVFGLTTGGPFYVKIKVVNP